MSKNHVSSTIAFCFTNDKIFFELITLDILMLKFSLISIFLFSTFCISENLETCITFSSNKHTYTMTVIGPDDTIKDYLILPDDFLSISNRDVAFGSKIYFSVEVEKIRNKFSIPAVELFQLSPSDDFRCLVSGPSSKKEKCASHFLTLGFQSMSGITGTKQIQSARFYKY